MIPFGPPPTGFESRARRPRHRRGLAVSGGGGTVGFYTDTATSEGNSISAGSWTTELDVRFTPETLNAGNQGTTTVHLESSTGNAAVDPATVEAELEGTAIEVPIRTCKPTKCLFEPKAGALVAAVDGESGEYTLPVTGELEDRIEELTEFSPGTEVGTRS